ncbi:unnamed protein product [Symbiodinium natans]|uniref:Uncharacterized protein n=1 Tax=Symbiodinium natans TaxID=878477 RepID=A0A812GF85_9DINO|nr:unnamed protein product [Symbiodinium natans]
MTRGGLNYKHLRAAAVIIVTPLALGLYFVNTIYASAILVICCYMWGHVLLRRQVTPFPVLLRGAAAALMLLCTTFITAMPWLVFGGIQGCREFDPTMKTIFGYAFEEFWKGFWIRVAALWLITGVALFLSIAEHLPSSYIRDCVRCCLFIYAGVVASAVAEALIACRGTDLDNDGYRDSSIDVGARSLQAGMFVFGRLTFFMSGIWYIQIVIKKLQALEQAFGEALPWSKAMKWLSHCLVLWQWSIVLLASTVYAPWVLFLLSMCGTLNIILLIGAKMRALRLPLRALQQARQFASRDDAMTEKTALAMSVLRRMQLAILLGNMSMVAGFLAMGLGFFLDSTLMTMVSDYASILDVTANAISLTLLASGSLSLPRCYSWRLRALSSQARPVIRATQQERLECSCGSLSVAKTLSDQVGRRLSGTSRRRVGSAIACERCSWDAVVQEIAGRRVSVLQLLDFYASLGSDLMAHFDPARSTTNDVVYQAIIPESLWGDQGKALAEVLPKPTACLQQMPSFRSAPRMVTHHWANRFRDLVAVVVADSLGLRRWDSIAELLSKGQTATLAERLRDQGSQNWEFWICALCINQHASICANASGFDTVTGQKLPSCSCLTPKYLNDSRIKCELNKFDSMMEHLHQSFGDGFLQVIAIDKDFNIFSRAWCLAELGQACANQLDQHVVLHSPEMLEQNSGQLDSLRVEDCASSRPEDKEEILAKIGSVSEIAKFNEGLRQLLLGSEGILTGWQDGEKLLLDVGAIAARAYAMNSQRSGELVQAQADEGVEDLVEL